MDIDAKQKVLYAFYAEYQKEIPDMTTVTADILQMDKTVFNVALIKLSNEGLISGGEFQRNPTPSLKESPNGLSLIYREAGPLKDFNNASYKDINLEGIMLTRDGIEFVENKLKIERSGTGLEKLKWLRDKFTEFGWEILKAYVIEKLPG